jgi:hypothetical protein
MPNRPSKRLVSVPTLLRMFKELGYEQAILEKRARAGKPYKDIPGHLLSPREHAVKVCHIHGWESRLPFVINTLGRTGHSVPLAFPTRN